MQLVSRTTLAILTAAAVVACKKPNDKIDFGQIAETGGDDGIFVPDIDLPSGGTGGEPDPVHLPPGECLQEAYPYVYGYVHQCTGSIQLSYTAKEYDGEISFTFGPGASNPD